MELNSAVELKETFKSEFLKVHLSSAAVAKIEAVTGKGNRVEASAAALPPDQRLSVGLSKVEEKRGGDYQIELRVQREGGLAHRAAEAFKEKARGEANVEVIPRIEAPSINLVQDTVKDGSPDEEPKAPLRIGLSVSHGDGPTGTLGAFVETKEGDAILSNCHVLAPGTADLKDFVFHPGGADVATLVARLRIAALKDFTAFTKKKANQVDAAIALLLDGREHDGNKIPEDCGHAQAGKRLKTIIKMTDLRPQHRVSKIGRTTKCTSGKISAIALDNVPVDIPGVGIVSFRNVVEIRSESATSPFTMPGDSGSIVFTDDDLAPFGLHFAGEYKTQEGKKLKVSYACDLEAVLKALGATWIK